MSRAKTLAQLLGSDGALTVADVSGAVNKAGDTMTGALAVNAPITAGGPAGDNLIVNDGATEARWSLATGSYSLRFRKSNTSGAFEDRVEIDSVGRLRLPYQPGFIASGTGGWITISASGVAPFNSIASSGFNDGGHFSTSSYAFTAPVAGKYLFSAHFYCGNTTSSASFMWLRNGGVVYVGGADAIIFADTEETGDWSQSNTIVLKLAAGDYVQVASRNTQSSRVYMPHSVFCGYLIG